MQDKNAEIRKMCDSCLDIISQMQNDWAARIKVERFRCHNGQWLSVVETLGAEGNTGGGAGAGDAPDDLPPYLSAEYLTTHRLATTSSDSQISLNDDSDSFSGEVDFNRANSRSTQDGQSDELLGLSDSGISGKTSEDEFQFTKGIHLFA
uniref:Kinesin associated protein 3 n=4 Tax=Pararge aegeria TaxID=116150 RepID=S4PDD1_9NEOP